MIVVTYSCTCDACGQLIAHKSQPVDAEMDIPKMPQVFGQDLCEGCRVLAQEAVSEALKPITLGRAMRRSS